MQLSLNKLPWYGQVGVFVALSAAALGAYFYFYDAPLQARIRAKEQQLATLQADITRGRALAARLPEFRAQVADLEARLDSLKAVLPEQKDVGDLLRRLQTLAMQSNLEIRGFKPQPISQKAMHAEWPIALALDGTYHDLGLFFDKVSKVPRIINISNLAIKAKDLTRVPSGGRVDRVATIAAECTATTFVLLENPPQAPGAAAPTAGTKPPPAVKR